MAVFNGSVNDIESKKNKVNSIRENASDNNYPSEKAVKDYVDKNADGGSGGGISEEELNDKIESGINDFVERENPEFQGNKIDEIDVINEMPNSESKALYPNAKAVKDFVDKKVGDIESALDSIIALQKGLIGEVNVINFTFDGITYIAQEGMTWREWCDSNFNTDGFFCDELMEELIGHSSVNSANGMAVGKMGSEGWEFIDANAEIIPGYDYIVDPDV